MGAAADYEDLDDPAVIRAHIEQTRAQMSETVDTIQARLSPENLKQQAQEAIREATVGKVKDMANQVENKVSNWRSNMMTTIRQNPVPAALVAIGVGWLLMSETDEYAYGRSMRPRSEGPMYNPYGADRYTTSAAHRSQSGSGLRETVSEKVDEVKGNLQETAQHAREQVSELAEETRERMDQWSDQAHHRAEELSQQAQHQMYRAKRSFNQMMAENPLAVGAAAVAIGATIGLLIPTTQHENEWMGEARDRFVEKAQTTAQQTMHSVSEAVKEDIREVAQTKSGDGEGGKTGNDRASHTSIRNEGSTLPGRETSASQWQGRSINE